MIETQVQRQAALQAAKLLRDQLQRLGAQGADIRIEQADQDARLVAVRSAGVQAEYGNSQRPPLRRLARAVETLRRGDFL